MRFKLIIPKLINCGCVQEDKTSVWHKARINRNGSIVALTASVSPYSVAECSKRMFYFSCVLPNLAISEILKCVHHEGAKCVVCFCVLNEASMKPK